MHTSAWSTFAARSAPVWPTSAAWSTSAARSASVQSTSAAWSASATQSLPPTRPDTPNTPILDAFKQETLAKLNISPHLMQRTDGGLHFAYQKYKAYLEASQTYKQMVADGSWSGSKLTAVDLMELFVSKSYFHSHYKKFFSKVSNYPLMVEWLENGPDDRPADKEVWGWEKPVYNFQDLQRFLACNESKERGSKVQGGDSVKGEGGSRMKGVNKKKKKQVK